MWRDDFSVLWKWHKSRLLPSCLRMLLYLDHDAYSCWRHLVAMRRLLGPSQGMKEAKTVCLWGGRGTIFCENLLPQAWIDMGLPLLAAEHLRKAVLKIQPRFISSRVSTTWWYLFCWFKTLCHCSKHRVFFSGPGRCHSVMSFHIFCDHMLLTVLRH